MGENSTRGTGVGSKRERDASKSSTGGGSSSSSKRRAVDGDGSGGDVAEDCRIVVDGGDVADTAPLRVHRVERHHANRVTLHFVGPGASPDGTPAVERVLALTRESVRGVVQHILGRERRQWAREAQREAAVEAWDGEVPPEERLGRAGVLSGGGEWFETEQGAAEADAQGESGNVDDEEEQEEDGMGGDNGHRYYDVHDDADTQMAPIAGGGGARVDGERSARSGRDSRIIEMGHSLGMQIGGLFSKMIARTGNEGNIYGLGIKVYDKWKRDRRQRTYGKGELTGDDFKKHSENVLGERQTLMAQRWGGPSIMRILFDPDVPLELKPRMFALSRAHESWTVLERRAVHAVWEELELRERMRKDMSVDRMTGAKLRKLSPLERNNDVVVDALVRHHLRNIDFFCERRDGPTAFEELKNVANVMKQAKPELQKLSQLLQASLQVLQAFLIPGDHSPHHSRQEKASADVVFMRKVIHYIDTELMLHLTADHFNIMAEAYLSISDIDRAEDLLVQAMESQGNAERTVELMVCCLAVRGEWANAEIFVEQGKCRADVLVKCLCDHDADRNVMEWKHVVRRLLQSSHDIKDHNSLFRLAVMAKDTVTADKLFREIQNSASAPNENGSKADAYGTMVSFLLGLGRRSSALDLFNEAISQNMCSSQCYEALLEYLLKHAEYERMEEVYENMKQNEVAPTGKAVCALLRSLVVKGRARWNHERQRKFLADIVEWTMRSGVCGTVWDHSAVQLVASIDHKQLPYIVKHQICHQQSLTADASVVSPLDTELISVPLSNIVSKKLDHTAITKSKRTRLKHLMLNAETRMRRMLIENQIDELLTFEEFE